MRYLFVLLLACTLLSCADSENEHDGIYRASTPFHDVLVIIKGKKVTFINPDNAEEKEYNCNQSSGVIEYQSPGDDSKRTLVVDPNNDLLLNNEVTLKRDNNDK